MKKDCFTAEHILGFIRQAKARVVAPRRHRLRSIEPRLAI